MYYHEYKRKVKNGGGLGTRLIGHLMTCNFVNKIFVISRSVMKFMKTKIWSYTVPNAFSPTFRFYLTKFEDYPRTRKAFIPFLL